MLTRDLTLKPRTSPLSQKAQPAEGPSNLSRSDEPPARDPEQVRNEKLYSDAVSALRNGDAERAVTMFTELYAKEDRRAAIGLGVAYFRMEDYPNAIRFLEESLSGEIDEFVPRKLLAFAYYRTDELSLSHENARAALNIRNDADLASLERKLSRESPTQEGFVQEQTAHFKVLYDGFVHTEFGRRVVAVLEDAYRDVGAQIGHFPSGTISVVLYTGRDFRDVTQTPDWAGGAYDGKIRIPVAGLDEYGADVLKRVLYHEYAHALVHSITNRSPRWINEGLAVLVAGEQRRRVGQEIPLSSLERSFPASQKISSLAYDVSSSAVAYLSENYGLYSVREYLFALSRGESQDRAFQYAFSMTYNEFVSRWGKQ